MAEHYERTLALGHIMNANPVRLDVAVFDRFLVPCGHELSLGSAASLCPSSVGGPLRCPCPGATISTVAVVFSSDDGDDAGAAAGVTDADDSLTILGPDPVVLQYRL